MNILSTTVKLLLQQMSDASSGSSHQRLVLILIDMWKIESACTQFRRNFLVEKVAYLEQNSQLQRRFYLKEKIKLHSVFAGLPLKGEALVTALSMARKFQGLKTAAVSHRGEWMC